MRVTIGQLRSLVNEELLVSHARLLIERDNNASRAEKIGDLVRATIKDASQVQTLFSYLRKLKVPEKLRQQLLDLLKKGNNVEIVAATRDLACDTLGVRPSMSGSGEAEICKPRAGQGKRAQVVDKVKKFFTRK